MKRLVVCLAVTLLVAQAVLVPIANAQEETKKEQVQPKPEHEPMLALLFGLIIPGGAQFYNGDTNGAIKAFAITAVAYIAYWGAACLLSAVTSGIAGILFVLPLPYVLQVWYAYQGYLKAQKIQAGTVMNLYQPESTPLTTK